MTQARFAILFAAVALAGALLLYRQQALIESERDALAAMELRERAKHSPTTSASRATPPPPSSELLKLRSEVTLLRQQLDSAAPASLPSRQQRVDEWAQVHAGPRLSQQPGFKSFASISPAGHATPDAAFETFQHAMRNQHKSKLTDTDMKRLWDVPDDYDDPNARYSINIGDGIGGEVGYKVAAREWISTNQVRLSIDYENEDGSSFRRERVLVERGGRWRLQPEEVRRIEGSF